MNETIQRVLNQEHEPTMKDISDILASIGKPGQKLEEKNRAIKFLFQERGGGINFQGHAVWDDLQSYVEY